MGFFFINDFFALKPLPSLNIDIGITIGNTVGFVNTTAATHDDGRMIYSS